MRECNKCAKASNCKTLTDLLAIQRHKPTKELAHRLSLSCKNYQPYEQFSVTVFERLLVAHPAKVISLLDSFGMKFRESRQKPYFGFEY